LEGQETGKEVIMSDFNSSKINSEYDLRNILSFYGHGLKSLDRIVEIELLAKGQSKKTLRKTQKEEE